MVGPCRGPGRRGVFCTGGGDLGMEGRGEVEDGRLEGVEREDEVCEDFCLVPNISARSSLA